MIDEEKVSYWKKRISDKLKSMNGQLKVDFNGIANMAEHIDLKNSKEIAVKMNVVLIAISKLEQEILIGKPRKEKN